MRRAAIGATLSLNTAQYRSALTGAQQQSAAFAAELKKARADMGPGAGAGRWTEFSSKLNLATGALRMTAGTAVKASLDIEGLKAKLATTADGTETFKDEMAALAKLSSEPGLGFEQVVDAAARLKNTGLSAAAAREEIKAYGNAIASVGGSAEDFEAVMVNVGQLRSGSGDLGEIKEIAARFPAFRSIADSLQDLRTGDKASPKGFMDAVLERIKQIPPAAKTARDSYSKLKSEISQQLATSRISGAIGGLSEAGSALLKGDGAGAWEKIKGTASEVAGGSDPFARYEMSPEQLAKKKAAEKEVIRLRREAEKQAAQQREAEAEAEFLKDFNRSFEMRKIEEARRDGDYERVRILEDALEVQERAAKVAKDYNISEAAASRMVKHSIKERRELEGKAAKDREAEAMRDLKERDLRSRGRTKAADKMAADKKEKDRIDALVGGGSTPEAAKKLAGLERDADEAEARMQRTGRRSIKGVRSENKKTGIGSTEFTGLDRRGKFTGLDALKDLQDDTRGDNDSTTSKIAAYQRTMKSNLPKKPGAGGAEGKSKDEGFAGTIKAALSGIGMGKLPAQIETIIEALQQMAGKNKAA